MKKQIVIFAIVILLIAVGFTGCFDSENESIKELKKFVGRWKHGTLPSVGTITFFSNGTCFYLYDFAEWKIENGKLLIDLLYMDRTLKFDYEFLDDDQILILTNVDTGHIDDYKKL